jgi:type IV secretion system protein VirD4
VVQGPIRGRIALGRVGTRLIAAEPQASLAVVGPTGCGKTAGFAIPALLEWHGPVIATSVKADLLEATVKHRSTGKVWVYDPSASTGHPGAHWSPLDACRTWAGALRIAAWLCEAAQPRLDSVSDGDYWYSQARRALAPYLYAAAVSKRSIRDVVRWIDLQDRDEPEAALRMASGLERRISERLDSPDGRKRLGRAAEELRAEVIDAVRKALYNRPGGPQYASRPFGQWPASLKAQLEDRLARDAATRVRAALETEIIAATGSSEDVAPLVAARSLWGKEPRLRGSVYATIENVLAGYGDPGVAEAATGCDIDLDGWLHGNNTIYVVAPSHEQARLRPVLTVLVQQAIRAAYDTANGNGGALPLPCLVLLDEAGNIAPLRDLPAYASTARSHGITIVSVWQDLAQVRAIYHDRAQTVINNHRAKLFGTGIADDATLDYVSRLIGDEVRVEQNRSADLAGGRRSVSEHIAYRRAAPIDVLRRIRPNEGVLVYGSELPAHVRLRPWFENSQLRAVADRPDLCPPEGRIHARLHR